MWDNIKYTNFHIIGVPKGEEREKVIYPENIKNSTLKIYMSLNIQSSTIYKSQDMEAAQVPNRWLD